MKHTEEQGNSEEGQEALESRETAMPVPAGGMLHGLLPRLKDTRSLNGMRREMFSGKAHGAF